MLPKDFYNQFLPEKKLKRRKRRKEILVFSMMMNMIIYNI